jgi:hypothetical protein
VFFEIINSHILTFLLKISRFLYTAQVGVAQKQMKDVKQILLSYLARRQIWLNYSYRLSSLWLRHKNCQKHTGAPAFKKNQKGIFFF